MCPALKAHRINIALCIFHGALAVFLLILLPALLLPVDAAWGWLLLPWVLVANGWWALIHESLHGVLHPDPGGNLRWGRIQGVLFGAPYELLRGGHLLHHAFSRDERDRTEVFTPGPRGEAAVRLAYYFRLLGGLHLFEVAGGLVALLPRPIIRRVARALARDDNVVEALAARLQAPHTFRRYRTDAAAIALLHALAFALYGAHAWMLLLALAGRGLLVSLLDNAFHYGTPLGQRRHARNLAAPPVLGGLILNFNLHGSHHLRPGLPWWRLGEFHRAAGHPVDGALVPAVLAQLAGPIPLGDPRLQAAPSPGHGAKPG